MQVLIVEMLIDTFLSNLELRSSSAAASQDLYEPYLLYHD